LPEIGNKGAEEGMELKVSAAGILLRDNKVLLGKRRADLKFYPDTWDIIGGHREDNETPEETLSRELKEEIGVTPTRFTRIAVLHEPKADIHGDYEYNVYLVTGWIGTPKNLSPDEHSELGWFRIEEALRLELAHPQYPELLKNMGDNPRYECF